MYFIFDCLDRDGALPTRLATVARTELIRPSHPFLF
jgi:hypothetical protein